MSLTQQKLSQSILSLLAHAGRLSIILPLLAGSMVQAGNTELDQARRIYDRLVGTPPSNSKLIEMETAIVDGGGDTASLEAAAALAMDNPDDPSFYNVTLKNYIAPWTNEDQTVFVDLNDYTATAIGIIRDDVDFREILSSDILYTGAGNLGISAYSHTDNNHYVELEALGPVAGDLSDSTILVRTQQSAISGGLPANATAGVMTTRAAAQAFFSDGTNRAMFRFTLMNHLCADLEPLKDISRVPDRVRQDVSRSPGGDSRIFMYSCVGCHAGMDGLGGAYAKYNFNTVTNRLDYAMPETPDDTSLNSFAADGITSKYHNNAENFKPGYIVTDDRWINYWRNGQNKLLGWSSVPAAGITIDARGHAIGTGAKSMGAELANSQAFASCQVKKAFKAVCFRDSDGYAADRVRVSAITGEVMSDGYNMKTVFGKVAAYCSQ